MVIKIVLALITSVLALSCSDNVEQLIEDETKLIEISKAQFTSEGMMVGEPELYPFAEKVHFTGMIIPSNDGQAQISLPLPGVIENIRCKPAELVSKGDVLFEVSGHWFIDLQKDFAESSAILNKLNGDYLRAKELFEENIATKKDFSATESSYYAEKARYKALKTKLESLGLSVDKIENGDFYPRFTIKSPIDGFVTNISVAIGQYVDPQYIVVEVVNSNSFLLKLQIFEKDIHKIKVAQKVEFYLSSNRSLHHSAVVNAIGKVINQETKAIECYASLDNPKKSNFVSNQFVEGEIYISLDTVMAIPETAIINSENEHYVLRLEKEDSEKFYFAKVKVNIGRIADKYVELNQANSLNKILIRGAYNIAIE